MGRDKAFIRTPSLSLSLLLGPLGAEGAAAAAAEAMEVPEARLLPFLLLAGVGEVGGGGSLAGGGCLGLAPVSLLLLVQLLEEAEPAATSN